MEDLAPKFIFSKLCWRNSYVWVMDGTKLVFLLPLYHHHYHHCRTSEFKPYGSSSPALSRKHSVESNSRIWFLKGKQWVPKTPGPSAALHFEPAFPHVLLISEKEMNVCFRISTHGNQWVLNYFLSIASAHTLFL